MQHKALKIGWLIFKAYLRLIGMRSDFIIKEGELYEVANTLEQTVIRNGEVNTSSCRLNTW